MALAFLYLCELFHPCIWKDKTWIFTYKSLDLTILLHK